jgi:hypothetical protein
MGFPIMPKGGEGNDERKRADLQTHGRMIDCHLSWFLHKSRTEMVVMTEDNRTVEMMGVM